MEPITPQSDPPVVFKYGDRVSVTIPGRPNLQNRPGTITTGRRGQGRRLSSGCERVLIDGVKLPETYHRRFLTLVSRAPESVSLAPRHRDGANPEVIETDPRIGHRIVNPIEFAKEIVAAIESDPGTERKAMCFQILYEDRHIRFLDYVRCRSEARVFSVELAERAEYESSNSPSQHLEDVRKSDNVTIESLIVQLRAKDVLLCKAGEHWQRYQAALEEILTVKKFNLTPDNGLERALEIARKALAE